jgi:hypothetical protein
MQMFLALSDQSGVKRAHRGNLASRFVALRRAELPSYGVDGPCL